jgi:hypothetical protein
MADKDWCLSVAIDIVKTYGANGECKQFPATMLQEVYKNFTSYNWTRKRKTIRSH